MGENREGLWFYGPNRSVKGCCLRDNGEYVVAELYEADTDRFISLSAVSNNELANCIWEEEP